eukprot:CAMPEP_0206420958 /NCGR_PEP_ID=MMETSP0324_2-20121206/1175_1 /ASSEMBLY_ACC=CAM_ASM_000836 /TAXON_ID=2866 /ORGANISM="Crypthecodinium cohnii, Strain Seligo" /LENGTH=367 /DNA_ID=CAMNT_0053884987 /DNA_START=150 /DNA_END=1253 /DNA_ORIENTATION=-
MAIPIFPLLHGSDLVTGLLFATKALCQIFCSPMFAGLIDRHCKAMLLIGLGLEVCSLIIFSTTFALLPWVLARGLSGVASAALVSSGFAELQKHFQDGAQRSVAMGLATTGIISGVCLGPVWGGTLFEIHRSLPFALLAGLELLMMILVAVRMPSLNATKVADQDVTSIKKMLACPEISKVLVALMLGNAAISCLESTTARYFMTTFGFTVGQVSLFYLLTSVPSCIASGVAGPLSNKFGGGIIMEVGLGVQGFFTLLGPKDVVAMEIVCFLLIGTGMGALDDGTAPAILGEVADRKFGGTGKIYLLSNVAVQSGFVVGPVLGNAVVEYSNFSCGMLVMGGLLFGYAVWIFLTTRSAPRRSEPLLAS